MLQKALGRSTNPDIEALSQQQIFDLHSVRVDEGWINDVTSLLTQMRKAFAALPRTVTVASVAKKAVCARNTIFKLLYNNIDDIDIHIQVLVDIANAIGKKILVVWCDQSYDISEYRDDLRSIPILRYKMKDENLFKRGGDLCINGFVFNLKYKNKNNIMLSNLVHLVYQLNGQVVLA